MALTRHLARAPVLRSLKRRPTIRRLVKWVRRKNSPRETDTYNRFILLGQQRTGSNLLRAELRDRYYIDIGGEVLNQFWREPDLTNAQIVARSFERVHRTSRAVGFTVFHSDMDTDAPELLGLHEDLKVIYLRRRNWLRSYVSLQIAEKYTYWIHDKPGERPDRSIRINPEHMLAYFEQTDIWQREAAQFLAAFEVHEVWYHQLRDDLSETVQGVASFLGLGRPRSQRLGGALTRQNPEPLEALVENMTEIRGILRNSPWSSFLEGHHGPESERFAHIA